MTKEQRVAKNKYSREYRRVWYKNNPDKVAKYHKQFYNRCKTHFPERLAIRSILRGSLIRMGKRKEGKTCDILGYSSLDLKNHLSKLFKPGMSWDNWGEWHIDHIKSVSKFTSDTHPSIVNALSNLQPLWSFENISKGNKDIY